MKKLLLSLGAVAAVAAPVAAVVACSSDKEAYVKVTHADNGKVVMHAFQGAATFANINGNREGDAKLSVPFIGKDGGSYTGTAFADLGKDGTAANLFTAIEAFNNAGLYIPTSFTSTDKDNKGVINALKGKTLKAEAFFQQDNKGGATYVEDEATLTTALNAVSPKQIFKLDTVEKSHAITLHEVGIRIVVA